MSSFVIIEKGYYSERNSHFFNESYGRQLSPFNELNDLDDYVSIFFMVIDSDQGISQLNSTDHDDVEGLKDKKQKIRGDRGWPVKIPPMMKLAILLGKKYIVWKEEKYFLFLSEIHLLLQVQGTVIRWITSPYFTESGAYNLITAIAVIFSCQNSLAFVLSAVWTRNSSPVSTRRPEVSLDDSSVVCLVNLGRRKFCMDDIHGRVRSWLFQTPSVAPSSIGVVLRIIWGIF